MLVHLKTALAVLVMASVPVHLGAGMQSSSSAAPSAKELRNAERDARTADDHLRIAAWYQVKADETRNELVAQEKLVNYWAQQPGMVSRTKIPNPLWNAQALARLHRERLQNSMKLATRHQHLAESLNRNATR